eukprot:gnl/MRDRNA2_/MRDRNA2_17986_c0_seq1.p1 gnl/MRDRNA2_/MRDRNA2_17986_c0~~gnl/MRDRNA2_/MRDRNA2_17986_c0_seq1.p1  ORF type:complete len:305 (+),score=58.32 gnl/MRDRNA2_/MRDRNA2_17986_c0_seq1:195-1109(+)
MSGGLYAIVVVLAALSLHNFVPTFGNRSWNLANLTPGAGQGSEEMDESFDDRYEQHQMNLEEESMKWDVATNHHKQGVDNKTYSNALPPVHRSNETTHAISSVALKAKDVDNKAKDVDNEALSNVLEEVHGIDENTSSDASASHANDIWSGEHANQLPADNYHTSFLQVPTEADCRAAGCSTGPFPTMEIACFCCRHYNSALLPQEVSDCCHWVGRVGQISASCTWIWSQGNTLSLESSETQASKCPPGVGGGVGGFGGGGGAVYEAHPKPNPNPKPKPGGGPQEEEEDSTDDTDQANPGRFVD